MSENNETPNSQTGINKKQKSEPASEKKDTKSADMKLRRKSRVKVTESFGDPPGYNRKSRK